MFDPNFAVPEAPAAIKALVMSAESILVSWKAPSQPNGVIKQYTVYYKDKSKEVSIFMIFFFFKIKMTAYPLDNIIKLL